MVFLIYGATALLALVLLYFFHANWYWHVLSVVAALTLGMMPPDMIPVPAAGAGGMARDIIVGALFSFLLIWGAGAPLFRRHHHAHVTHPV